jgi:putative Holliday junction resolvase
VSATGRLLAVDHGKVRLGLAVSDAERRIASPLTTYQRRDRDQDARFFRELVRQEEIVHIIVGLPAHLDGHEGEQARKAREFGAWLATVTGLPVTYWDESFTTWDAEGHLLSAGLTSKRRKARRDRVAAQIILQTYLDSGLPARDE